MKKFLLSLILLLTYQVGISQCTASVSDFGNNTNVAMYNISSSNGQPPVVDVILNNDNTITLDLGANFQTADGPDIRAFLINSNGNSDAQIQRIANKEVPGVSISNFQKIEFGLVGSLPGSGNPIVEINGAKSLTVNIPNGVSIEDFDKLLFYCELFEQFWDVGSYTSFSSSNCSVLSVEENSLLNTVNFYPNPTNENITISNDKQLDLSINIFNVLGNTVLQTKKNAIRKQIINLSSLKSGVYLVQLKADGQTYTKRLIKQ